MRTARYRATDSHLDPSAVTQHSSLYITTQTCRYSRCGRTDKGVSALGQVVSLCVRSAVPKNLPEELLQQLVHPLDKVVNPAASAAAGTGSAAASIVEASDPSAAAADDGSAKPKKGKAKAPTHAAPRERVIQEMDYVSMLNRALPDEIRVLGWSPVTDEFSARFSASHRTYRYFFLKKSLDIAAMQQAAQLLVGEHDFRNLSKLDIANVSNFRREVYYAKIVPFAVAPGGAPVDSGSQAHSADPDTVYMLEISGIAFLWHMVRAIMAVLFMVGEGLEQPSVVPQLLDVTTNPGKPPYSLADELPLVLHECGFDRLTIPSQPRHLWQLTAHYRGIREAHLLAAARAQNSLEHVLSRAVRSGDAKEFEESLRQQEAKHAKSSAKEGNSGSSGSAEGSSHLHKRKLEAMEEGEGTSSSAVPVAVKEEAGAGAGQVVWAEALARLEGALGHVPRVKYVPHVPLMQVGPQASGLLISPVYAMLCTEPYHWRCTVQRKKEHTYEEKIRQLAGNKKVSTSMSDKWIGPGGWMLVAAGVALFPCGLFGLYPPLMTLHSLYL